MRELLSYVGRNRSRPGPLGGFRLNDGTNVSLARSCEHNIDLAAAFDRMAALETDPVARARWEQWRDSAEGFRNAMYGQNPRFATLGWISDGWNYFRAGTGLGDDVNHDLVPIDTQAWSSLARGDDRGVSFALLGFLASSEDPGGRSCIGFDPGFRAVADEGLTSRRDGVGSEVTAYMVLVARRLGDAAIISSLPARASLAGDEQWAYDVLVGADGDAGYDFDLADFFAAALAEVQLHAPNGDGLGLVAAAVRNVGTGEYDLVNGWSLAATCWGLCAFRGWNIFTAAFIT